MTDMLDAKKNKAVAYWLLLGVGMIMVQILLGGITRLTGSGLSITEWKPIMGALPPLSEAEWQEAFEGYKNIAQYKYMNSHFELADFKFIFFWEWFHRLWARLLGIVFIIGFVYFWRKGYFNKSMIIPLVILFILGAAQGLVGWIMVASGLNDSDLYVNHIKLALHFIAALLLLCYTLWFALKLLIPDTLRVSAKGLHYFTIAVIAILSVQLVYGAFMSGLKAAMSAPTWPDINGMWVPDTLNESLVNNKINVQFIHRQLAYLLGTLIIIWFGRAISVAKKLNSSLLRKVSVWPLLLVFLQITLGVVTVVSAPKITFGKFGLYETLAEAHQLTAMFLLVSLIISLFIVKKNKTV